MAEDEKSAEDFTLGDLTEAIDGIREQLGELRRRVENIEENTRTKVRVVDTDRGKRIVLENRQQTWFSPNYFRTILDRIESGGEVEQEDLGDEEVWEAETGE